MHQKSLGDFFQVKKKVCTQNSLGLPNVIRYDTMTTEMEVEPPIDYSDDFFETTDHSPSRKRKEENLYSFSQEDMRMQYLPFNAFMMSNPLPFMANTMMMPPQEDTTSKHIENYFNVVPRDNRHDEYSLRLNQQGSGNKQQRKFRDDENFLGQWLQKSVMNHYSWKKLPKEMMLRIMSFLTLKDNARIASVCRYFKVCYNSIWLSYDYFSVLNFQEMGTDQVEQIFEHGGKLPHVRQMKKIMSGKKLGPFLQKNSLQTRLSAQFNRKDALFEEFSLKPSKPNVAVLITDRDIQGICESSTCSLLYVNLTNCQLLTNLSYRALSTCTNMQHLSIKGGGISDDNVGEILYRCRSLTKLCLSGCENLTDRAIEMIAELAGKLEVLDLSANKRMACMNLYKLANSLYKLTSLNLGSSHVTVDHFLPVLKFMSLKTILVEGAVNLNDAFLYAIIETRIIESLEKIDLSKNKNFSEQAVWLLVNSSPILVDVNYALMSDRIINKVVENRHREEQVMRNVSTAFEIEN